MDADLRSAGGEWCGDVEELRRLGAMLDEKPAALEGQSLAVFLAETLLRVRMRDGVVAPLKANAAQLRYEERRGRRNIVLKARQMGMTSWICGRMFLRTLTQPGTLTVQVAQTRESAESLFRVAQRFWENLPEALREGAARRGKANAGQMTFPAMDSEFRVLSAADEGAGRGLSIQNLHCSELAHWPGNAGDTMAGLKAALSPTGELVLESTPNGAAGCFYNEWLSAEVTGAVQHFLPWWLETAYKAGEVDETSLNDEELKLIAEHGLTRRQIGFRRGLKVQFRGLAQQEYVEDAESCFLASGSCIFEMQPLVERMKELRPPTSTRQNGKLQVWFPPVAGKRYVIGVDTAGGGEDGDAAAAQVVEMETGLQCAELLGQMNALELARATAELAKEYNNALLAVERNNHGHAVIANLQGKENYGKLYEQGGAVGWLTSSLTRPRMIALLGTLLSEKRELFQSARLLAECRTFVRLRHGGSGAAPGAHDDCVMAMAIAYAVREEMLETGMRRMAS